MSVVNSFSVAIRRMVGNNEFTEFDDATFTSSTINFQFLGIRLLTNSTNVVIPAHEEVRCVWRIAVRGPADPIHRRRRATSPGVALTGLSAEQSNHPIAGVAGINWLPVTGLHIHFEGEIGTNSNPFAPRDQPARLQALRASAAYRRKSLSYSGAYRENYNDNSIVVTSYSSHARTYSGDAAWTAKSGLTFDASYTKLHLDTIGGITFFAGTPVPVSTTGDSIYVSNIHALNMEHISRSPNAPICILAIA